MHYSWLLGLVASASTIVVVTSSIWLVTRPAKLVTAFNACQKQILSIQMK